MKLPDSLNRLKFLGGDEIPGRGPGTNKTDNVIDGDYRNSDGRSRTFWEQDMNALPESE